MLLAGTCCKNLRLIDTACVLVSQPRQAAPPAPHPATLATLHSGAANTTPLGLQTGLGSNNREN